METKPPSNLIPYNLIPSQAQDYDGAVEAFSLLLAMPEGWALEADRIAALSNRAACLLVQVWNHTLTQKYYDIYMLRTIVVQGTPSDSPPLLALCRRSTRRQ